MDVVPSVSVWQNVEGLGEPELFLLVSIHAESSHHEDDDWTLDGSLLDVGGHVGVLDFLEGEGLYFFWDLFESGMFGSCVGHPAAVLVEVDELLSLFPVELHDFEVFVEEHVCNLFVVHS